MLSAVNIEAGGPLRVGNSMVSGGGLGQPSDADWVDRWAVNHFEDPTLSNVLQLHREIIVLL